MYEQQRPMNASEAIPPKLVPNWPLSEPHHDFDMDDAPDVPVLAAFPLLASALGFLQQTLWPAFDLADKAAIHHQMLHRRLASAAAIGGSLAVLFGILQLGLPRLVQISWLRGGEILAAIAAIVAVSFGLWAAAQFRWLLRRHQAERLRGLKFQLLAHPDLWCGRAENWQAEARRKVATIQAMNSAALVAWEGDEHVPLPTADLSRCTIGSAELRAMTGYYIAKRLDWQLHYFAKRSREFTGRDRLLRNWPAWCFYASVLAAFLHFLVDVFGGGTEEQHAAALGLILLAVALPVVGASVRTVRLTREFGRSASLFRAKHAALLDLRERLLRELDNSPGQPERVLRILAACEDFLEAEHREWLRLMREAEWFG